MFNFFFSFSIGEAGFKMLNLEKKRRNVCLDVVSRERCLKRKIQRCGQTLALDTGNTRGGGGLLSCFFGLVGLKYSNSLIHLENTNMRSGPRQVCVRDNVAVSCLQINRCVSNWPLSAGTRVTPACAGAQSCRFPAACLWSCQPGWGACSGSGGTDAHLKNTQQQRVSWL